MTAILIYLAISCLSFGFYFGYTFAKEVKNKREESDEENENDD